MTLTDDAKKAIEMIVCQIEDLEGIVERAQSQGNARLGQEELKRWKSRTVRQISSTIDPIEGQKLDEERLSSFSYLDQFENLYRERDLYSTFLHALRNELEQHPEDILSRREPEAVAVSLTEVPKSALSRSIFIVHGHDETLKQSVARLLEKLELKPVILHEQPDMGKTIIEKLEAHSSEVDIGYAIVILTPDDLGAPVPEKENLNPRARQNVVLELGYFIAKLGRHRVRTLYTEGVELPSDYKGVLYTKIDNLGAWKLELAREIKATGIDIDLNKIVS